MSTNHQNMQSETEDQIDIVALLAKIWASRKFILIIVGVFSILGIVIALATPNQYTASSMFTPNTSKTSSGTGGLKGLASLAGINLGSMDQGGNEISPMLYDKIMESATFKKKLLMAPLQNLGEATNLKTYFELNTSFSILGTVKEYTIGLPSKLFGAKKTGQNQAQIEGVALVSQEDFEYSKIIDGLLSININDKDGYIEIAAKSKSPEIAAQVTKNAIALLQAEIIKIKTKSSLELLTYLEEQYVAKQQVLTEAQNNLSNFKDSNFSVARIGFSNTQTRLETEMQIATSVFQNVVTQLEQVKLQVAKDTPVFSIVKPVVLPNEKSDPKRSLIVLIWVFLGAVLSISYVLAKEPVQNILREIKNKDKAFGFSAKSL